MDSYYPWHFIWQISLDSEKKTHVITSYKMLGFLVDFGGFMEALNIVFSMIGTYFSSQFFKAHMISKYFF